MFNEKSKNMELPKDAIEINNRYGRRYPIEKGYYGYIVSRREAYHYWQMAKYTIDIFRDGEFVTTIVCESGEF